jgi:hypothetical protein
MKVFNAKKSIVEGQWDKKAYRKETEKWQA